MKKLLALLAIFTLAGCSLSDDETNFHFEFVPIESVVLPESFELNETYEISVSFLRPNDCYLFHDLAYSRDQADLERTVAVVNTVFIDRPCAEVTQISEVSFNFIALYQGTYTFRFWQGQGENGEDLYLTVEVPVVE